MKYTFDKSTKSKHYTIDKDGFCILSGTRSRVLEKLYQWRKYTDDFISFDELIKAVWGRGDDCFVGRSLDVHLCEIRRKIKVYGFAIERKYGVGLRLVEVNRDDT